MCPCARYIDDDAVGLRGGFFALSAFVSWFTDGLCYPFLTERKSMQLNLPLSCGWKLNVESSMGVLKAKTFYVKATTRCHVYD